MIKAVVFDLNGVFVQGEYLSERIQKKYGVSAEDFLVALKEVMKMARKPGIEDSFVLWKPYLERLGLNLTRDEFFNFWFSGEKIVPELLEYAQELRAGGVKVLVLSNNFRERTEYYRQNYPDLFANLDATYFSWETGNVKPDGAAYNHLLTEQKLQPEECVYFDDSVENVEVARKIGMNSFKYEGLEAARRNLESFGISANNRERK